MKKTYRNPIQGSQEILVLCRKRMAMMKPGEKFPTVRALMKEYEVGQVVICRALHALQQEGLIESHVGKGTFVSSRGAAKSILWVCGLDMYNGDIASYYMYLLQFMRSECARHGFSLDPAWLCNYVPEDSEPFCRPDVLDRYEGFLFVGCDHDNHPFYRYVVRNTPPFVLCSGYGKIQSRWVQPDIAQMLDLAFSSLASRGLASAMVVVPKEGESIYRDAARQYGIELTFANVSVHRRMSGVLADGYAVMSRVIREQGLPESLIVPDSVVAQAATRAILEQSDAKTRSGLNIVVCGSRQMIVPLGLPVIHVAFDATDVARHAVDILMDQIEGRPGSPDLYQAPFSIMTGPTPDVENRAAQTTPQFMKEIIV